MSGAEVTNLEIPEEVLHHFRQGDLVAAIAQDVSDGMNLRFEKPSPADKPPTGAEVGKVFGVRVKHPVIFNKFIHSGMTAMVTPFLWK